MEVERKPFQGVINIVRFNWHFYALLVMLFFVFFVCYFFMPEHVRYPILWLFVLGFVFLFASLGVSWYIYDFSDFYSLKWLPNLESKSVLSLNAGFDETSQTLRRKFGPLKLVVADFYNEANHTEISIQRARKIYPPATDTVQVTTKKLPFSDGSFDVSILIFSAHEIRNTAERVEFFKEIHRVTKEQGLIYVTEHLRDAKNFFAYSVGFFHFLSRSTWLTTFERSNLRVLKEIKSTPFITTFIIGRHEDTF
jgi:SAM-dependent methyltransferase